MFEKIRNKGQLGGLNIQTVLVISLASVLILGYLGYIEIDGVTQSDEGDTRISVGYILENGTEVPLEDGEASLYMDQDSLTAYASSAEIAEIEKVYFDIETAVTGSDVGEYATVEYSYEGESPQGDFSDSGEKEIQIKDEKEYTKLTRKEHTVSELDVDAGSGSREVTIDVDVTANYGELSASANTSATVDYYWAEDTFQIDARINDSGTLSLYQEE